MVMRLLGRAVGLVGTYAGAFLGIFLLAYTVTHAYAGAFLGVNIAIGVFKSRRERGVLC